MHQLGRNRGPALRPRVLAWGSLIVLAAALAVTLFVDPIKGMLLAAGALVIAALSAWSLLHPR
jgi:hypothetical protein